MGLEPSDAISLILVPAILDYLYQRNLVGLMGDSKFSKVILDGGMSGSLGFGLVRDFAGSHFSRW